MGTISVPRANCCQMIPSPGREHFWSKDQQWKTYIQHMHSTLLLKFSFIFNFLKLQLCAVPNVHIVHCTRIAHRRTYIQWLWTGLVWELGKLACLFVLSKKKCNWGVRHNKCCLKWKRILESRGSCKCQVARRQVHLEHFCRRTK